MFALVLCDVDKRQYQLTLFLTSLSNLQPNETNSSNYRNPICLPVIIENINQIVTKKLIVLIPKINLVTKPP